MSVNLVSFAQGDIAAVTQEQLNKMAATPGKSPVEVGSPAGNLTPKQLKDLNAKIATEDANQKKASSSTITPQHIGYPHTHFVSVTGGYDGYHSRGTVGVLRNNTATNQVMSYGRFTYIR